MKTSNYTLIKLEAEPGKVFDWADFTGHTHEEEDPETGEMIVVIDHLYAKVIYLGAGDSVDNYMEVDDPALRISKED